MRCKELVIIASYLFPLAKASRLQFHDGSFSPDYNLQITYDETAIACEYKPSVLVNGNQADRAVAVKSLLIHLCRLNSWSHNSTTRESNDLDTSVQ